MKKASVPFLTFLLMVFFFGCYTEPMEIFPGEGIGPLKLGMTYREVNSKLKSYPYFQITFNRISTAFYLQNGISAVFSSPKNKSVTKDAVLISIGCKKGTYAGDIEPGMEKSRIEAILGEPDNQSGDFVFYNSGISVQYKGGISRNIGIYRKFDNAPTPPEMNGCK